MVPPLLVLQPPPPISDNYYTVLYLEKYLQIMIVYCTSISTQRSGEDRRAGEKGASGVREARVEGPGSGIPKVVGSGRNRGKITQHCAIFRNRKSAKRREPTKLGGNRD